MVTVLVSSQVPQHGAGSDSRGVHEGRDTMDVKELERDVEAKKAALMVAMEALAVVKAGERLLAAFKAGEFEGAANQVAGKGLFRKPRKKPGPQPKAATRILSKMNGKPMKVAAISKAAGISPNYARVALARLAKARKLKRVKRGVYQRA